jgi:hypothetical protein
MATSFKYYIVDGNEFKILYCNEIGETTSLVSNMLKCFTIYDGRTKNIIGLLSFMKFFSKYYVLVIFLGENMYIAKVVSTHLLPKCQVSIAAFLLALSSCYVLFIVSDSNCYSHMQNSTSHIKYIQVSLLKAICNSSLNVHV